MPSLPQPKYTDVSTVVSILPYPLLETKPGLIPERWKLGAAEPGDFRLMPVQRCIHHVYIDDTRPRLTVPDPSDVVAQSIVIDHKTAMYGYVHGEAEPGIGWVQGEYVDDKNGKAAFLSQHSDLLDALQEMQKAWFKNLVRLADDDWARYKQHKFITDLERTAATMLGLTNREWLIDVKVEEALSVCKFCFARVHPAACICMSCKGVLDVERYKKEFLGVGEVEAVVRGATQSNL